MAQKLQTVEQLTSIFGFPQSVAEQAVEAVGLDATTCYNYILDKNMAEDSGGPVNPIDNCPHVEHHVCISTPQLMQVLNGKRPQDAPCSHRPEPKTTTGMGTGGLKQETLDDGSCPAKENWLCLECGVIRCSRYANGHSQVHWNDTKGGRESHCIHISFSDLSVWCNCCNAYVLRDKKFLPPLLDQLEYLKFLSQQEECALPA